jgi:hypothetical protein
MNKVPHCRECDVCNESELMYITYYCEHPELEKILAISVDKLPITSPPWCPKRKKRIKLNFE